MTTIQTSKSLQATRDGARGSAFRFTIMFPACLCFGRSLKALKFILTVLLSLITFEEMAHAGRPIILTEAKACADAQLVVIATIDESKDAPSDDPFSGANSSGFTRFAKADVTSVLLGIAPAELFIHGGKLPAGTDYRLEKGQFLILLVKVQDGVYRAVDWHYSFVPFKNGKVGWLTDRNSEKRMWITPKEAVERISSHKPGSERGGGSNPAKPVGSP